MNLYESHFTNIEDKVFNFGQLGLYHEHMQQYILLILNDTSSFNLQEEPWKGNWELWPQGGTSETCPVKQTQRKNHNLQV